MKRFLTLLLVFGILAITFGCGGGGGGEGGGGGGCGQPPSAPANLSASAGDRQVHLSWNAVPGASYYNIYWSTNPGVKKTNGTKIGNITDTSYIHDNLTNGTTYYYVVTAVNSYGESSESNEANATPSSNPPPPPSL
jgi:mannan endo-1,4-beta-mannosidase